MLRSSARVGAEDAASVHRAMCFNVMEECTNGANGTSNVHECVAHSCEEDCVPIHEAYAQYLDAVTREDARIDGMRAMLDATERAARSPTRERSGWT